MTDFITINKKHFPPGITVEEHAQNGVIVSACLGIIAASCDVIMCSPKAIYIYLYI
jgi:hypothetical protein